MAYAADRPTIKELAAKTRERRRATPPADATAETWEGWWEAVAAEPGLRDLYEERERRFEWRDRTWANAGLDFQIGALKDAGFREVDVIWQRLDNRVLMAVR
jgi:hypothetical protein